MSDPLLHPSVWPGGSLSPEEITRKLAEGWSVELRPPTLAAARARPVEEGRMPIEYAFIDEETDRYEIRSAPTRKRDTDADQIGDPHRRP